MIPDEWFEEAQERIAAHIVETPLTRDQRRGLLLKWENRQTTGSFKVRGALNKVLSLEDWEVKAGLVAASAGNHGQGVALAAGLIGAPVEVFVPQRTGSAKVEAIRGFGAQLRIVEGGYAEAEAAGRRQAAEQGKTFVSPYNDGQVIAGQGTLALEILGQLSRITQGTTAIANWVVPTGGGGLISACGAVISRLERRPRLIGVQAEASPFAHSLFHRHSERGVKDKPTLAEGLSGALESGSVTIPMMERYVDDMLLVSEQEIGRAIAFAWYMYGEKIEGSAAVGLACVLGGRIQGGPNVVLITGGNIQPEVHASIVRQYEAHQWN